MDPGARVEKLWCGLTAVVEVGEVMEVMELVETIVGEEG